MNLSDEQSLLSYLSKSSGSSYHFLSEEELEYMSLIQNRAQPYFPRFAATLAEQSPLQREQGRCAAVDFTESQDHQVTSFATAAELDQYLGDVSPPPYHTVSELPRRRLFILEDLPCNHILALGSRLKIPPSFFAGHWEDPASSTFNHRSPFQRCALPHFRLRYATSNRVEVDTSTCGNGGTALNIFAFDARVSRFLHTYSRGGLVYDEARSHHNMSFWSSPAREDGSWDAVLLVDPPLGQHVRCMTSRALIPLRTRLADETSMPKYFLNPEMETPAELSLDCSQWASSYSTPGYTSMFDDTLQSFTSNTPNVTATHDPLSVVEFPRRLVISTLIAYIRRRYLNLVSIHNSTLRPHTMRHNYLASFSKSNYSSWSTDLFDFILGCRACIKEFAREMDDNAVALGLTGSCSSPNCGVVVRTAEQWERDGWQSIRELTAVVEETVNAFAAGYLQYVTIQEAHVSNGNAQSLARITVLTMLFIPLSTVASIFSMGGDFLPGENRAWVFWVVAIPLLAVLAWLYWYRQIVMAWRQKKELVLPMFAKGGGKG
ncbi:Nn.00g117520.m01.CDS01 [Neocucurbitaria sp. VM-36]